MLTNEEIARRIKGAYIPIRIDSVADCPHYNCLIVNDLVLLSYGEAHFIYNRNKHCSRLAKVVTNSLVRWCVIALYNVFLWSIRQPEYMIIKQKKAKHVDSPKASGSPERDAEVRPSGDL